VKWTIQKVKDLLIKKLDNPDWKLVYDKKKDELRIENKMTNKGITVSLPPIVAKAEVSNELAIDETVYYVTEALKVMGDAVSLQGQENNVYPVIRSTSFPKKSKEGKPLIMKAHTAETRIYYALDLGTTYRLIDQELLDQSDWDLEKLEKISHQNLSTLSRNMSKDTVAGNVFYFVSTKDGYDASKILLPEWLEYLKNEVISGEMAVAVPHGDVCIIVDIRNKTGYDVLAQMCMSFFANGHVPITALSFMYTEGKLEPVFILGKNK